MSASWPPTWDGPMFKNPGSAKVKRGLRREARESRENSKKQEVRIRDKYCRFPLCGCKRFQLALEVSHDRHKGAGGNPAEDRSDPDSMLLLCAARHKENVFAVDRKNLRWRALTRAGSHGPIAWDIDLTELRRRKLPPLVELAVRNAGGVRWLELARETGIHVYEPTTADQTVILAWLKGMEL